MTDPQMQILRGQQAFARNPAFDHACRDPADLRCGAGEVCQNLRLEIVPRPQRPIRRAPLDCVADPLEQPNRGRGGGRAERRPKALVRTLMAVKSRDDRRISRVGWLERNAPVIGQRSVEAQFACGDFGHEPLGPLGRNEVEKARSGHQIDWPIQCGL